MSVTGDADSLLSTALERVGSFYKWKPWEHSTGPVTEEGKERSAQNSTKTGWYSTDLKQARAYLNGLDRERRSLLQDYFQNFSELD